MNKLAFFLCFLMMTPCLFAQHHMENSVGYADSVNSGIIVSDTMKGSPHRVTMTNIGNAHIHIEYGSPGVKGRIIWGGLVAYDKVWVAGAHNATIISFGKDVIFGGKHIPAGMYGFFAIPGKDKWTVMLNSKAEMHLADEYEEKNDIARIEVKPVALKKEVPRLTYIIKETGKNKGDVIFQWDKLEVSIPVSTK